MRLAPAFLEGEWTGSGRVLGKEAEGSALTTPSLAALEGPATASCPVSRLKPGCALHQKA